jgi:hypothetical protein
MPTTLSTMVIDITPNWRLICLATRQVVPRRSTGRTGGQAPRECDLIQAEYVYPGLQTAQAHIRVS